MRVAIALLALGSAFVIPAAAYAAPVYSQPYTTGSGWDSGVNGYTSYDNFTLSSATNIGAVSWDGALTGGTATSFTVDFYANNGGTPGALLFANSVGASNPVDTGSKVGIYEIYGYSSSISPFAAAAGTEYWLSIVDTSGSAFYWSSATGGDGRSYQTTTGSVGTDLAFTLTATPEPSSLILLGTGLAGFAGLARRRFSAMRGARS